MLSYIELNKTNLIHNYNIFRSFVHPQTKIICVVKGNAYGHGLAEVVTALDSVAEIFAVNSIEELRKLRLVSNKPVLVLGYIEKESLEEAVDLNATLGIYDKERLELINSIAQRKATHVKVHLKIDALLGRQGIFLGDLEAFLDDIQSLDNIEIEAIYAHFSNIEDTSDFSHAQKQIDIFEEALAICRNRGYTDIKKHISASAGILVYDQNEGKNDFVRLGVSLYGMWPPEDSRYIQSVIRSKRQQFELKPVLRWVSHIAQVKLYPSGHPIGYGLTYVTTKPTKIAVIPQGYSDGYDRGLSSVGEVLIRGTRCKVLGRVMMNMINVDVSHLPEVKAEDEVVLLGTQGQETILAEDISSQISTIKYEITTRLSSLLPRIII